MPTSNRIEFQAVARPVAAPVTKFGGQPVWLDRPVLPTSRITGQPMTFIAQIRIPSTWCAGSDIRLAYVFMTGAGFDDLATETWDPNGGETAVIVQSGRTGSAGKAASDYPNVLQRSQWKGEVRTSIPCEYTVAETPDAEPDHVAQDELSELDADSQDALTAAWRGNKIGGSPDWVQSEEFPFNPWHLLLQLEDSSYPFDWNLGTGVGYVFLNEDCTDGAVLWQC